MRNAIIAALVCSLAACATPYRESGLSGGVRVAALGGDTYRIEAYPNAYSSQSTIQDYLILRAAETAQQQGAVGFIILGAQDTSQSGTVVIPGQSNTNASADGADNSAHGQSTTSYSPSQAYHLVRLGGMMMIQLVREPVPAGLQYIAIGPRVGHSAAPSPSPGYARATPMRTGQPAPPSPNPAVLQPELPQQSVAVKPTPLPVQATPAPTPPGQVGVAPTTPDPELPLTPRENIIFEPRTFRPLEKRGVAGGGRMRLSARAAREERPHHVPPAPHRLTAALRAHYGAEILTDASADTVKMHLKCKAGRRNPYAAAAE